MSKNARNHIKIYNTNVCKVIVKWKIYMTQKQINKKAKSLRVYLFNGK